jgi:hypothetical protein
LTQTARRKTRDIRTLTSGLGSIDYDYVALTTADWQFIEQKLKAKIPQQLRDSLRGITEVYFAGSHIPHRELSVGQAKQDIELWADRTRDLRKLIWNNGEPPKPTPTTLREIITDHFHLRLGLHAGTFPLAHLAQFLDGAEAIARYFVHRLEKTKDTTNKKTELWLIWAAFVIALCQTNDIPVKRPSKKIFFPGFLILLEKLQATLRTSAITVPPDIARGIKRKAMPKPPIKKGESLRKSAWLAFNIAEENPTSELFMYLIFRCGGWLQFGEGTTDIEQKMAPLQSRLQEQAMIRKRPTRTA